MAKKKAKTLRKRPKKRAATKKVAGAGDGKTSLETGRRRQGRPKKGQSPLTPEVIDKIAQMYSRCRPEREIAREIGVDSSTVHACIVQQIRPIWREHMLEYLGEDLIKVREIETTAWEKYRASKDPADLTMAKWAIEHRAKVAGHFAPTKLDIKQHAQVRVAGKSPAEFDQETIEIILKGIIERRQYQAVLAERGVEV